MITVGLADDHRIVREGLRTLLMREPDLQVVGEAANGRDALLLVRDREPDVLVLDINMPGLNGVDVCRQLSGESQVRVVVLSMHTDVAFVRAAIASGAMAYVVKDSAPEELVAAIRKAMAGERFVSPQLTGGLLADYSELAAQKGEEDDTTMSQRHREVLQLLAEGRSTKEIASELHLSARTVETYRAQLMRLTGYRSTAELVKYAIRIGLTNLEE